MDKNEQPEESHITVSAGFGFNTRKPFIRLEGNAFDQPVQFEPEDAIGIAFNMIHAAECARTEAFLFEFATKNLEMDEKYAFEMIVMYRAYSQQNFLPPTPSMPEKGL